MIHTGIEDTVAGVVAAAGSGWVEESAVDAVDRGGSLAFRYIEFVRHLLDIPGELAQEHLAIIQWNFYTSEQRLSQVPCNV